MRDAHLGSQPASATFSLPFFLTRKNLHIFRVYKLMSLGISVHVRNPRHHPSYNISITSPSFLLSQISLLLSLLLLCVWQRGCPVQAAVWQLPA